MDLIQDPLPPLRVYSPTFWLSSGLLEGILFTDSLLKTENTENILKSEMNPSLHTPIL